MEYWMENESDAGFGEGDPQMSVFGQFVIMHWDERLDCRLDVLQLKKSHFVVFSEIKKVSKERNMLGLGWMKNVREELEGLDGEVVLLEHFDESVLVYIRRDVREMKRRWWRVDVHIVLAAWLLEPVKGRMRIIPSKSSIRLTFKISENILLFKCPHTFLRQLYVVVLGRSDPDDLVVPLGFVQVLDRWSVLVLLRPSQFLPSCACWGSEYWMRALSFLL